MVERARSHLCCFLTRPFIDPPIDPSLADGGQPVKWLNELEWVEGLIWGNVWQTDCIAQVRPGLSCCRALPAERKMGC